MADKPILFSGPMVRALIARTKTQTRRLPSFSRYRAFTEFGPSDTNGYDWHLRDSGMRWHDLRHSEVLGRLPWHFGDRLYVREAWRASDHWDDHAPCELTPPIGIAYIADNEKTVGAGKFRQGMHMPRWASRITLTVTDVRLQRLLDISAKDAIAEGIYAAAVYGGVVKSWLPAEELRDRFYDDPRQAYFALLDHLHGDGFSAASPWLAAYTFTVAMGNIDDLSRAASC